MSDTRSSRPRLVSVNGDGAEKAPEPSPSAAPAGTAPRRLLWLLVVLVIVAVAGLAAQTVRTRTLEAENAALAGELFATRSALDAYVARFAEVRLSLDGLRAQVEQLDALVSADPLAPAPDAAPETAVPGD
jgi:uncharacterized protein HemX